MYMGTCVCVLVYISIYMHGLCIYVHVWIQYEPLHGTNEVAIPASGTGFAFAFVQTQWDLQYSYEPVFIWARYIMDKVWFSEGFVGVVAQLHVCPTGDLEVAGLTPAGLATFFRGDLIMKYFLQSFSPFRRFKKGSCQFLAKECAEFWLTT